MPISIDEFESFDPEDGETNAERVIRFLARHPDKAYRAVEIAESTGVDGNSIHPVLSRLEERGLVRHKEPYWAIGDPDTVRNAMEIHWTAGVLDGELGGESRKQWLCAARRDEGSGE